jgi:hypothetical protein
MLEFEYARSALKNGLKLEAELGVNPYKFGMIGSTDAHTALSTADDNNFWGKIATNEPSADRWKHPFVKTAKGVIMGWEQTASGYAAVWAQENTRVSLFDANQRREVYATTGPRMTVRFSAAGIMRRLTPAAILPQRVTRRACRWAASCRPRRRARRRPSSSLHSRTRSVRTSIATRS